MRYIKKDIYEIQYSDYDQKYINKIAEILDLKIIEIMDFFRITNLKKYKHIKLWDNIDEFRNYQENLLKSNVPDWVCASSSVIDDKYHVDVLNYKELRKIKRYSGDTFDDFVKTIIHELVHSIYYEIVTKNYDWIKEGLATYLSRQYNKIQLNCSLDELLNDFVDYQNYYSLFSFCVNNYNKDYVIKLILDYDFAKKETPKIFDNAYDFINSNVNLKN